MSSKTDNVTATVLTCVQRTVLSTGRSAQTLAADRQSTLDYNESKRRQSGSAIRWTICISFTLHSRQLTTPEPHHSLHIMAQGCINFIQHAPELIFKDYFEKTKCMKFS